MGTARVFESVSRTHLPRTTWCCQCDRALDRKSDKPEDVGPIHHIAVYPDHVVIEVVGEFHVWRYSET